LAASIKQAFAEKSELIEGSHGVFDVKLDGELIYSKDETGRFPENEEIIDLIQERQA
jgi:selenoprotein W-related protein